MNGLLACALGLLLSLAVIPGATAADLPVAAPSSTAATPSAENSPLVIIYTLSDCQHCKEAKAYFKKNHIAFENREIDTNSKHMDDLMTIYDKMDVPDDKRGVPFIIIGDTKMHGFSKTKVQEALKKVKLIN